MASGSGLETMDDTEDLNMEELSLSGSFFNQEASVSIEPEEEEEEEEDLYYTEPRRPSLDLGPSPMETGALLYVERPSSPAENYLSMTSEGIGELDNSSMTDPSSNRIHLTRTESFSSCYSVDSEDCEIRTKVKSKDVPDDDDAFPELKEVLIDEPQPHLTVSCVFKAICEALQQLNRPNLEWFRRHLWQRYPQSFSSLQSMDTVDIVDRILECYSLRVSLQITKAVLQQMNQKRLIEHLEHLEIQNEVEYKLKKRLKEMFDIVEYPGGEARPLDEVYVDLHIVSKGNNGPNIEHEVMSIKKLSKGKGKDLCIADITSEEQLVPHREEMILLSGVAGSGKSMAIRRLVQEWCHEEPKRRFTFVFVFSIKELKQIYGDTSISFLDILHHFYPETRRFSEDQYRSDKCSVLYIFDGLEEIAEDLNVNDPPFCYKKRDTGKLSVIISSILRRVLMRSTLFLFTSRPMPHYYIPYDTMHKHLEVLGFKEEAREEYFRKRFKDPKQANRVIAYVKSSRTLQTICHLPLFCSLLSDLCQNIFNEQGVDAQLPKGITHMYTRLFLALLIQHHKDRKVPVDRLQFIMALGKRAFTMLEKGEYYLCITYQGDFEPLDEDEAATYSGLSTLFYLRHLLTDDKMFSFMHSTMQEYMAALYAFLTFVNEDKNIFEVRKRKLSFKLNLIKKNPIDLFKVALERSLLCEDGKMDIFMRFLFGMTNASNIELLQCFVKPTVKWASLAKEATALLEKNISKHQDSARVKNLQLCLEELSLPKQEIRKHSFQ